MVARLEQQQWWGAILGPHGAGKSTLLHTLVPQLEQAGRQVVRLTLSHRERSLSVHRAETAAWNAQTQVVVDGYEQLNWWRRWRFQALCRRRGAGLLVTAHGPIGIAELWRVEPALDTVQQVVARLLQETSSGVSAEDVAESYARHGGNVREALFDLFDLHQLRGRSSKPQP